MVWEEILSDVLTDLHICQKGTVTAHLYIEDILLPYSVLFARFVGAEFL